MRNTVRMAPTEKTPERIAAGERLQDLRVNTLKCTQRQFADAIGASLRQVAAAEGGDRIGKPTKQKLEDGLGWSRGDWDQFVATGEHPPVRLPLAGDEASEVVRMSAEEIARAAIAIAKVQGDAAAEVFLQQASELRRRAAQGPGGVHVSGGETSETPQRDAG